MSWQEREDRLQASLEAWTRRAIEDAQTARRAREKSVTKLEQINAPDVPKPWTIEAARERVTEHSSMDHSGYQCCVDIHDDLEACLDLLEWRPIESAPKDGTCILAAEDGDVYVAWWNDQRGAWWNDVQLQRDDWAIDPTHWRPIGPGPEGK